MGATESFRFERAAGAATGSFLEDFAEAFAATTGAEASGALPRWQGKREKSA